MNPTEEQKLCVKELASSLGVSTRYVYEMRRCGFTMEGLLKINRTSTAKEAAKWVIENDFRIVDGFGRIGNNLPINPNLSHRAIFGVQKSAKSQG